MIPALLALQAVVFLLWALLAFRLLFRLAGMARVETGQPLAGPVAFLRMAGLWWRDPDRRAERLWFGALTLALLALSGLFALVAPPAG